MREIRVRLKLPDDHPLLRLPQKNRSEMTRAWIDFGMTLADIKKEMANIKVMLNNIEKRLEVLEIKLTSDKIIEPGTVKKEENYVDQIVDQVDVNAFLSAFDR